MLFIKTTALLRDLAGGRADGSWEPRLRKYLQSDVLILDDFGMREFSPSQAEDLYELICERYRSGSMIVTSNRRPRDWYGLFPNAVLAESALDRLVNSAHHVVFRGRTYRPLRRPDGGPNPADMDDGDAGEHPNGLTHQVSAAETAQEPRDDPPEGHDTSGQPAIQRSRGGRTTVRS